MSRYKAYAEYKESGVDWMGKIPIHWQLLRFKHVLHEKKKTSNPGLDAGSISFGNVIFKNSDNLSLETKESYQEVLEGEFLINPLNLNYDLMSLRTALSSINVVVSTGYIVLQANGRLIKRYIRWLLQQFDVAHMKTLGSGVRQTINYSDIGNSFFYEPSQEEQISISNFLDHETAKIDALIEKQQELIKLLKEKRQAVISHAVTKGLNPNAPMRDSGVEWLGEVPAHWTITKAKFLFGFITSGSRGWAEYYADDGDLFFRITNLTRDTIDPKLDSIQYVTPPNGSEGERSRIKLNDLLISITADLGSVCVANSEIENGYVSQHVALCRPNMHVACPRWLGYFILSDMAKEQFIGSGYGGTKIQLSLEDIRELWVVLPNVTEQIEIAVFIEKQFDIFDSLMFSADQQIKLLQERRTALISAAVTGKIDVRDWQPSSTSTQPKAAV